MFWLFKILRSREWREWPRWKKALGAFTLILLVVLLVNPDFVVFAGLLDISILDVFITLVGIQLLLYSSQIKALAHLTYAAITRRIESSKRPPHE